MEYAVIQSGGKQYKISEGSEIEVDKLDAEVGSDFRFESVLLHVVDGVSSVGQPNIDGAVITAKVLEQKKGVKIRVAKFKAKARYRKVQGHRQLLTKLQITKIAMGSPKAAKTTTKVKEDQKSKV